MLTRQVFQCHTVDLQGTKRTPKAIPLLQTDTLLKAWLSSTSQDTENLPFGGGGETQKLSRTKAPRLCKKYLILTLLKWGKIKTLHLCPWSWIETFQTSLPLIWDLLKEVQLTGTSLQETGVFQQGCSGFSTYKGPFCNTNPCSAKPPGTWTCQGTAEATSLEKGALSLLY